MNLTRREFCVLTDLHVERLKSLQRRPEQFPAPAEHEDTRFKGHRRYTPWQVVQMVLIQDLVGSFNLDISIEARSGLPIVEAQSLIKWGLSELVSFSQKGSLESDNPQNQIYLVFYLIGFEGDPRKRVIQTFAGHIRKVSENIVRHSKTAIENGDTQGRIVMVNASDAMRRIRRRATENAIDFKLK